MNRRSPLFYVGDKYKLISQLKEHFPTNIYRFIEPFCGGGSVFLNINAKEYFLNDIDSNIICLQLWNEDNEIRLVKCLDNLNNKGVRFAVSNVLWHKERYNGIFNEWVQGYNTISIKSNYISFNDNTKKDTVEVLVKNYA